MNAASNRTPEDSVTRTCVCSLKSTHTQQTSTHPSWPVSSNIKKEMMSALLKVFRKPRVKGHFEFTLWGQLPVGP
jgi:hypothetical protein